ncbi:MAG TPA: dihydropteroate synthase [Deltaproteobacteria bacterium]|nr:dihydropteroate synthase [Deltaproteobacteria bacterium]
MEKGGRKGARRFCVRVLAAAASGGFVSEMERIGVDPVGVALMAPKQTHYNLKVEGLSAAQANIVKQEMLAVGGEAAVSKGVVSCAVERTDALLSGTKRQMSLFLRKLRSQPYGLGELESEIRAVLDDHGRVEFAVPLRSGTLELRRRTAVMGILNVTPDSFYDGGRYADVDAAVERAVAMAEEGADIIDIGAESSRPGARPVDPAEQKRRLVPVLSALARRADFTVPLSVDTTSAEVAGAALQEGVQIVNDISALRADEAMAPLCARSGAAVVLMHMRGTPATMQLNTAYGDIVADIYRFFVERVAFAVSSGIEPKRLILDPGIGFGKDVDGNLDLLGRLGEFRSLGLPLLVGLSRKSFIGKVMAAAGAGGGGDPLLTGTVAAHAACILAGASILRVHDVAEARAVAAVADALKARL